MARAVGDMVDITSGTETAERVADPTGDVGRRLGPSSTSADALKGWTVVRVNDGKGPVPGRLVDIRKMADGKDILMPEVNPDDLKTPSTGGKRRTRKGKKSTKKSRKLRKLRKTRGRKH